MQDINSVRCLTLAICFAMWSLGANAQSQVLRVGDPLPDYTFDRVFNHNGPLKLGDFKGRLVILDFWSTGCAVCIETWPKLNDLATKYGDKIALILVNTHEDSTKFGPEYRKWEKRFNRKMQLPSVYSDSLFLRYFDFRSVPHVVWVDQQGIVQSITHGDFLNSRTIDSFLAGKPRKMPQKLNEMHSMDFNKPLFVDGNGPFYADVKWQSLVTGYASTMAGSMSTSSSESRSYIQCTNGLLLDMLRVLHGGEVTETGYKFLQRALVELNVPDTNKYVLRMDGQTQYGNLYCYTFWTDHYLPAEQLRSLMLSDIGRYFDLAWRWEPRRKKCLVLKTLDSDRYAYRGGERRLSVEQKKCEWNSITVEDLVYSLSNSPWYNRSKYPFVDATGYNGKIGPIRTSGNIADHRKLDRKLRRYGLSLTLEERDVDVLVVTEVQRQQ